MKVLKRGMDAAFYIRRNYEKLHVRSRSQAVANIACYPKTLYLIVI